MLGLCHFLKMIQFSYIRPSKIILKKTKNEMCCCAAHAPALEKAGERERERETALVSGGAQKRIGEPSCLGDWRPAAAAEGLNENIAELGFKLPAEHGVRLIWQSGFNWNRRSSPRRSVHYCPVQRANISSWREPFAPVSCPFSNLSDFYRLLCSVSLASVFSVNLLPTVSAASH